MGFLSGVLGAATGFLTGGPAGAVIGGAAGFLGGKEKDKAEKEARAQQNKANGYSDASLALQKEQMEIAKKRQEDYDKTYGPIEKGYLSLVTQGVKPDIEGVTTRAIGDVNTQFANSEAARLRQMQRTGVNPNSGRADSLGRQLSLSRALALAGTVNQTRQQEMDRAKDLTYARYSDANQVGINKLNNAQSNVNSAATALSQTYANQSSNALIAKQNAQAQGNNAANSWADLGGTVFKAWDQYKNKPAKTTVGTGVWM